MKTRSVLDEEELPPIESFRSSLGVGSNFIRDLDGTKKVDEQEAAERWRGYFEVLLNEENSNILLKMKRWSLDQCSRLRRMK